MSHVTVDGESAVMTVRLMDMAGQTSLLGRSGARRLTPSAPEVAPELSSRNPPSQGHRYRQGVERVGYVHTFIAVATGAMRSSRATR